MGPLAALISVGLSQTSEHWCSDHGRVLSSTHPHL